MKAGLLACQRSVCVVYIQAMLHTCTPGGHPASTPCPPANPNGPSPGVGVAVGDAAGLADAIVALWRDPPRRAAMAQVAQARVAAGYSLERAADRFWGLYQAALRRPSSQ